MPAVLLVQILLPIALLAGGYLWQIVPRSLGLRFGGLPKLALIFLVLALSVPLARVLAVPFEALVFAGNIKAWLNGDVGSGIGFTAFLLFPVSALLVSVVSNVVLADLVGRMTGSRVWWRIPLAELVR